MDRLTDMYISWLGYSVFGTADHNREILFNLLWGIPFRVLVDLDENRLLDGVSLRKKYTNVTSKQLVYDGTATVLEVLVALAFRMNEITWDSEYPNRQGIWFTELLNNLGLNKGFTDDDFGKDLGKKSKKVCKIVHILINRGYDYNGKGGLFPLKRPKEDQRELEIWYQMMDWLTENGLN